MANDKGSVDQLQSGFLTRAGNLPLRGDEARVASMHLCAPLSAYLCPAFIRKPGVW